MLAQTHLDQLALLFPFLFQPANENPTWSQSRGVGGGEILPVGWWCWPHTHSKQQSSSSLLHQVWFCGCGREDLETRGPTGRVDRSWPPRPRGAERSNGPMDWPGCDVFILDADKNNDLEETVFLFCLRRGVFAVLDVSGSLLDRDPRGRGPAMNGRAKVPQLVGWGIMLLRLPLRSEGVRTGSW